MRNVSLTLACWRQRQLEIKFDLKLEPNCEQTELLPRAAWLCLLNYSHGSGLQVCVVAKPSSGVFLYFPMFADWSAVRVFVFSKASIKCAGAASRDPFAASSWLRSNKSNDDPSASGIK